MIVAGLLYIGSVIVSLILQDWGNLVIALILVVLSAVPLCTERWVGLKLPLNIQIQYGLLILAGPYLGGYWGLYVAWPPWDTWVHFYSGIFISLALIVALGKTLAAHQLELPVWLEITLLITAKAFIALLWEIAEFSFDVVFDANTQDDNFDTMTDMIVALGPSLVIAAAFYLYRRRGSFRYFGSLLDAGRGKL